MITRQKSQPVEALRRANCYRSRESMMRFIQSSKENNYETSKSKGDGTNETAISIIQQFSERQSSQDQSKSCSTQ
jgi:hypothetical protein|tara:strand:+ start:183 stop:407 length:225 start_codon:yes stop_codon:yes gene_type:complete